MAAPDAQIEKPLGGVSKMGKVPKMAKVKNKAPAELQITAEQLLREAKERELEIVPAPPKQKIQDEEELADYQMRKRKNFEDALRKNRSVMSNWIKYATWEESQNSLDRARFRIFFFILQRCGFVRLIPDPELYGKSTGNLRLGCRIPDLFPQHDILEPTNSYCKLRKLK
jgi:hypothetical protein